jgi:N-methylhydantoinase A/oxoprolinase/acetone carboxylase beta subunit
LLASLGARARADLRRDELDEASDASFTFALDLRYAGEHFELTEPLPVHDGVSDVAAAVASFHQDHERLYGFWRPDEPLELVSVRLRVRLPLERGFALNAATVANGTPRPGTRRPVLFDIARGPEMTDVYDGRRLGRGAAIPGPAVIHRLDGTVPIPPQWQGEIDTHGHLILTRALQNDTRRQRSDSWTGQPLP